MQLFELSTAPGVIEAYFKANNLLDESEKVEFITKPGEGNMNVVLRVKTNTTSYILKQSRDFVQKYPDIAAPINRIRVEHQFYKATEQLSLASHFPKIVRFDNENHLIVLEDLGEVEDLTRLYPERNISNKLVEKLVKLLSQIHRTAPPAGYPKNSGLRKLNHQHIFVLPFLMDNGFGLDTVQDGLQELSLPLKENERLKQIVNEVGKLYLSEGTTLLHGDYYPGSWMQAKEKVYVLDPEFSFLGFKEFDLGVMLGHLILISGDEKIMQPIIQNYEGAVDVELTRKMAGIEIIRRLIGLAQLPLERTLQEKERLLHLAHKMVIS